MRRYLRFFNNQIFRVFNIIIFIFFFNKSEGQFMIGSVEADTTSVLTGLDTPWEILWGPDNFIWFTERPGRVSRFNPATGERHLILTIPEIHEESESGLLGMVLHPNFNASPYVYLVYDYKDNTIKERLVRYTYAGGVLTNPLILLDDIRGFPQHNGSRLTFGPDNKLYMTTGDAQDQSSAQDTNALNGKVLRLNEDGSVPSDNPFGNYVWTLGHRNPQGILFSPDGKLYISEHGESTDDEINIIEKGRNYGWPFVEGYCDLGSEKSKCDEINVMQPIHTWTPTVAPTGISYYNSDLIPEWKNCILVTTLAGRMFISLKLGNNGESISEEKNWFMGTFGRLRDECISPEGLVFISTSNKDGRGNPVPGDDRIVMIHPKYGNSIRNLKDNHLKVTYLNNQLLIEYKDIINGNYIIYNNLGQTIDNGPFAKSLLFNTNKFHSGLFIIKVYNFHSYFTTKFIIN